MANPNATIHNIPLETTDINLSKYKSDIKPYQGFVKQNSPYYGDILSTFYSKTESVSSWADNILFINELNYVYINRLDGGLYINRNGTETKLLSSTYKIQRDNYNASDYPLSSKFDSLGKRNNGHTFEIVKASSSTTPNIKSNGDLIVWTSDDGGLSYYQKTITNAAQGSRMFQYGGLISKLSTTLTDNYNAGMSTFYSIPITSRTQILEQGRVTTSRETILNYMGGWFESLTNGITYYKVGKPMFRVLYNNMEVQGISVALDTASVGTLLTGLGTLNSDNKYRIDYSDRDNPTIAVHLANNDIIKITVGSSVDGKIQLLENRYVLTNFAEYYNAYDLKENKPFHWASDFNNRVILYCYNGYPTQTPDAVSPSDYVEYYLNNATQIVVASGQGSNPAIADNPFISTQFPMYLGSVGNFGTWDSASRPPDDVFQLAAIRACHLGGYTPDNIPIQVYVSYVKVSSYPQYLFSLLNDNTTKFEDNYANTRYSQGFIGTPSVLSTFIESNLNKTIVSDNGNSYILDYIGGNRLVVGYNTDSEIENVDNAFIIQGQLYLIQNKIINNFDEQTSIVTPCVNIGDMKFLGFNPYMALFFSETNRTVYAFRGSNTLDRLYQINEYNFVNDTGYNYNTQSIYAVFNNTPLIFTNNQLIKIEDNINKIYPSQNGFITLNGGIITKYTYNKSVINDHVPIWIKTAYYGQGSGIVSINDCVYVRLFYDSGAGGGYGSNPKTGQVYLNCNTLRQGVVKSSSKTFNITADMWDKDSNTILLRYQPQYQEAEGFQVEIQSDFPIAELKISETPVSRVNSKYNI